MEDEGVSQPPIPDETLNAGEQVETEVAATDEVGEQSRAAGQPHDEEAQGAITSTTLALTSNALILENDQLAKDLRAREAEVLHFQGCLKHALDEAEVRTKAAQESYDFVHARLLALAEKHDDLRAKFFELKDQNKATSAEHKEYEALARRTVGLTIAEAELKSKELLNRCVEYRSRYGEKSWQYREQVDKLKKIFHMYEVLGDRNPALRKFVAADDRAISSDTSVGPSSSSRREALVLTPQPISSIPTTTIVDHHNDDYYSQANQRRLRQRGRGSGVRRSTTRGSTRGRGRGRGRISIDTILEGSFEERWLNFSSSQGRGRGS